MKKITILILLPFVLTACLPWFNQEQQTGEESKNQRIVKEPPKEEFILLQDVTGGSSEGDAYRTIAKDGTFIHKVAADMPALSGTNFYEGWLVIPGTTTFISTGEMTLDRGRWVLDFESEADYTDYSRVVITIEPDDGDPAPAAHILEGEF